MDILNEDGKKNCSKSDKHQDENSTVDCTQFKKQIIV